MNFKQAVGSENIYGVFNVFVKKIRVHLQSVGEKNHPHGKFVIFEKFVFNYFSLVSGSGGQDSFYSFNSCSKKHYSHGKSVSIRVQKTSTCTVEHPLSACHPIAYFPLSNPSFHFSVDYCCSNNSKCSASLS